MAVEGLVVFVLEVGRLAGPQWLHVVDDVVLVSVHLLSVLPFGLFAKGYRNGQEVAVLAQQAFHLVLFEEFCAVVVDVHDDVRASFCLVGLFHGVGRTAVTGPFHCLCAFLIAACDNVYAAADHIGTVESQSEVSDDGVGVVLVLVQEVACSAEGNLVDVFLDFICCHAYTVVAHGDGLVFLVEGDSHLQVAHLTLEVAFPGQGLELLSGVYCIAHNLTDENLVVAVEKLFDDGEDVLCCNPNVTLFHCSIVMVFSFSNCRLTDISVNLGFTVTWPSSTVASMVVPCTRSPERMHSQIRSSIID